MTSSTGTQVRNPSLTVVITCYNHERFIRATLESVLQQSVTPEEIIVIDDASTDRSPEIIDGIAQRSPLPIRAIRRPQNSGGPARPSNEAVAAVRTPLVAMLDGDDVCVAGRLEAQSQAMNHSSAGLCFGLTDTVGADGVSIANYKISAEDILVIPHRRLGDDVYALDGKESYRELLEHRNFVTSFSNMMFRKAAWEQVGRFSEKYRISGDTDFVGRCCSLGELLFVSRVTCIHVLHGANLGGSNGIRNRRDLITLKADHARRPSVPGALRQLSAELPQLLMAEAYWEARSGEAALAVSSYLRAAAAGAPKAKALAGAIKSLPIAWLARAGFRRTP